MTKPLNERVEAGDALPYQYMGLTPEDYLSLGQWQQGVLAYIKALRAVVDYYRAGQSGDKLTDR